MFYLIRRKTMRKLMTLMLALTALGAQADDVTYKYLVMKESNGTLTRRVDANGDALATPTTEQVTVPTLTTTGTAEQFNVLTTLAPSEVSLTYHGWHEHD